MVTSKFSTYFVMRRLWSSSRLISSLLMLTLLVASLEAAPTGQGSFKSTEANSVGARRCFQELSAVSERIEAFLEEETALRGAPSKTLSPRLSVPKQLTSSWNDASKIWQEIRDLANQSVSRTKTMFTAIKKEMFIKFYSFHASELNYMEPGVKELQEAVLVYSGDPEAVKIYPPADHEDLHTETFPAACMLLARRLQLFLLEYEVCAWTKKYRYADANWIATEKATGKKPVDMSKVEDACKTVSRVRLIFNVEQAYAKAPPTIECKELVPMTANYYVYCETYKFLKKKDFFKQDDTLRQVAQQTAQIEFTKLLETKEWLEQAESAFESGGTVPPVTDELLKGSRPAKPAKWIPPFKPQQASSSALVPSETASTTIKIEAWQWAGVGLLALAQLGGWSWAIYNIIKWAFDDTASTLSTLKNLTATTDPSPGLDPWLIALIVAFAIALLIGIVYLGSRYYFKSTAVPPLASGAAKGEDASASAKSLQEASKTTRSRSDTHRSKSKVKSSKSKTSPTATSSSSSKKTKDDSSTRASTTTTGSAV